jgi:hypothetical protein
MPLEPILKDLVARAEAASPNAVKADPLQGGLNINLRKLSAEEVAEIPERLRIAPQMYLLTIWREGGYPALREWNTVCAHMPHLCPIITPAQQRHGNRFLLRGRIPARKPEGHATMESVSDWIFASKAARTPRASAQAGGRRKPRGEEST